MQLLISQDNLTDAWTFKQTWLNTPKKSLVSSCFCCKYEFKDFYDKKRKEGKHHLVAVNAVARKMCHVIYAVLKKNEPYVEQK